jgi:hypothetical protein
MSLRIPRLFTSALTAGLVTCIFISTAAVAQKSSSSSSNSNSTSNDQRIQHVETGIVSIPMGTGQPPLQFDLQQLMKALKREPRRRSRRKRCFRPAPSASP